MFFLFFCLPILPFLSVFVWNNKKLSVRFWTNLGSKQGQTGPEPNFQNVNLLPSKNSWCPSGVCKSWKALKNGPEPNLQNPQISPEPNLTSYIEPSTQECLSFFEITLKAQNNLRKYIIITIWMNDCFKSLFQKGISWRLIKITSGSNNQLY